MERAMQDERAGYAGKEPQEHHEKLTREAERFVDSKGEQLYYDYVQTANFEDGKRSRGWLPGTEPARRMN
jgi:hypothetical protein